MKYFKTNLIYLLEQYNMTQSELQKQLKLGDGIISKYCSENPPEPKASVVNDISTIFKVDLNEFINTDMTKQISTDVDNTMFLVCKKLISETKLNIHSWEKLNWLNEDGLNEKFTDLSDEWLDSYCRFESKFMNDLHDTEDLIAYSTNIDGIGQFVIINFKDETDGYLSELFKDETDRYIFDNRRYELYLVKQEGQVIECCASYSHTKGIEPKVYKERFGKMLSELYYLACNYQRLEVFNRYLNQINVEY